MKAEFLFHFLQTNQTYNDYSDYNYLSKENSDYNCFRCIASYLNKVKHLSSMTTSSESKSLQSSYIATSRKPMSGFQRHGTSCRQQNILEKPHLHRWNGLTQLCQPSSMAWNAKHWTDQSKEQWRWTLRDQSVSLQILRSWRILGPIPM